MDLLREFSPLSVTINSQLQSRTKVNTRIFVEEMQKCMNRDVKTKIFKFYNNSAVLFAVVIALAYV